MRPSTQAIDVTPTGAREQILSESRTEDALHKVQHDVQESIEERFVQLQDLSATFASAVSTMQVADAILSYGFSALGAGAGSVALLSEDNKEFTTVRCVGYTPEVEAKFKRYPYDTCLPNADAARTGMPLFVETLEERNRLYPHLVNTHIASNPTHKTDDRQTGVIPQVGRGALAALPLIANGRTLGGISFSFPTDRNFDPQLRAFIQVVAQLSALALMRTCDAEAAVIARQSIENRYRALFENSRDAICVASDGVLRYVNQAYAQMFGYESAEDLEEVRLTDITAAASRAEMADRIARRSRGENVADSYEFRGLRRDGVEIDLETHVSTYTLGGMTYTQAILRDITARKKREKAQKFMADASALLVSSLDIDRTLENIASLAVPHISDWCVIHLVDTEGILQQVAVSHIDPVKITEAHKIGKRYPPDPRSPRGVYEVLRSGKSDCLNDIPEEIVRAAAQDEEHLRILLSVGMRSFLCVALEARNRKLGTITFLGAESIHRFGPEDVALAEELAHRAALAVDNARLYQEAREEIVRRKQAEAEWRVSEERFRTLADALPQFVWSTDASGQIDYVNQRWTDYAGLTHTQTRSDNLRELIHPEDANPLFQMWTKAFKTGHPFEKEFRCRRTREGAYRWFLCRIAPVLDAEGSILRWVGTSTDIDSWKIREETQAFLTEMNERIRPLTDPEEILWQVVNLVGSHLDLSRCHFVAVDSERNRIMVNRAYIHNTSSTDGLEASISDFGPQGFADAIRQGITIVVNDTANHPFTAGPYLAAYEAMQVGAFVAAPCLSGGKCVACLIADTQTKREWTHQEIELLETIAHRTWLSVENARLLRATQAEVQERRQREQEVALLNEKLQRAMAETHHRVKNNLQVISALADMSIQNNENNEEMVSVQSIRRIAQHTQALASLHDLLTQQVKGEAQADTISVEALMAKLLPLIRRAAGERPISAVVEDCLITSRAGTSLALLVNELVSNAIKHADGEISVALRVVKNGSRNSVTAGMDDQACLEVSDNGPGFPPDFNPIQAANTGLELVTSVACYDLRGAVAYENRPEGGGRVVVTFPTNP